MTLSSFNYCLMCQSWFFFVCSRTSSCGEIIFLESYENFQTTEYFYFVPAYCTLYIETHRDLKTEKWCTKICGYILGVTRAKITSKLNQRFYFYFLPIKEVLVWFCCCWFFLLLRLLHYADFVDVWAHCACIYSLYTIQTYFSNAFECEEKTNVTLEHLKTFLHDLSLTFVLKWAIVNRFSPK